MTNDFVSAWSQQVTCPAEGTIIKNQRFVPEKNGAFGDSFGVYSSRSKTISKAIVHQTESEKRTLLFLENCHLKLMILPEVGGQVQIAINKTTSYHKIDENQLLKPALIGLTGPWIFGGNEFIWPSHYNHCLNKPLDWWIEEGSDGSKTIWCATVGAGSEVHGVNGFRLFPDRAYLEIELQLYNHTSVPQSVELLWGAYSDPASDRYWLQSGEEKRFTQAFMPFRANESAQTTTKQLAFLPIVARKVTLPASALPIFPPEEIISTEELFLTGLYLEQHQEAAHTPYAPERYYQEGLRRDPADGRCNNALGLLLYRRGQFAAAEGYFRKAIEAVKAEQSNPLDGEPFYNLGLTLIAQGDYPASVDLFDNASESGPLQDAAYFELACLASRDGRLVDALALVTCALQHNQSHHKARHLKIALLRRLQRPVEAATEIDLALTLDLMPYGARWEVSLLTNDERLGDTETSSTARMAAISQQSSTFMALALDYRHAGLWREAMALLTLLLDREPMAYYFLTWCHIEAGHPEKVDQLVATLRHQRGKQGPVSPEDSAWTFSDQAIAAAFDQWTPSHRLDALRALQSTIRYNPNDDSAFYLLGLLWYGFQQYEVAVTCWEQARSLTPTLPFIHRDLGIAYLNQLQDCEAALVAYERAFALDITDVEIFCELDQLYKLTNLTPQTRLDNLELHDDLVIQHDGLSIERIRLLNLTGYHDEALDLLAGCSCYTWVGKAAEVAHQGAQQGVAYPLVIDQYQFALIEQAKKLLIAGDPVGAIDKLHHAQCAVNDLGQASLQGIQKTQIFYYLGCAFAALGEKEQAQRAFLHAIGEPNEPDVIPIYEEERPETLFYQALAHQKVGDDATAEKIFHRLIDDGKAHVEDQIQVSHFASLLVGNTKFKRDINRQNRIHCSFMSGLGYLGLEMAADAIAQFDMVLKLCSDHEGAIVHKRMAALSYA